MKKTFGDKTFILLFIFAITYKRKSKEIQSQELSEAQKSHKNSAFKNDDIGFEEYRLKEAYWENFGRKFLASSIGMLIVNCGY
jgi:hypothetical protein